MGTPIKYYPEDLQRDFGSLGIKLPMNASGDSSNNGIFNMSYSTEEQAVSNYINLLLTKRGERYMQPNFGIGIQNYIFDPSTQVMRSEIELVIRQQAGYWLPYIINRSVDVRVAEDIPSLGGNQENGMRIIIIFGVTESGANQTITVFNLNGITRAELV